MNSAYELFDIAAVNGDISGSISVANEVINLKLDDFMPEAITLLTNNEVHIPLADICRSSIVMEAPFVKATRRPVWIKNKLALTQRGKDIRAGKVDNIVADSYNIWMSRDLRTKAAQWWMMVLSMAKIMVPGRLESTYAKFATAATYSALGESQLDPCLGEIASQGTGVGLIQYSFGRNDRLFLNMARWHVTKNKPLDVMPSIAVSAAYLLKELRLNEKKEFDKMFEDNQSIEDVVVRFLWCAMGSNSDARCLRKEVIPRRVALLNPLNAILPEYTVTAKALSDAAENPIFRGKGACPNAKNYGRVLGKY